MPDTPHTELSVSIVVCAFSNERYRQLCDSLNSLLTQTQLPEEIIAVIDHNDTLLQRITREFVGVKVLPNTGVRGNTGGRNSGIRHSTSDVVAFIDDDAIAQPDWLSRLMTHYRDQSVIGVGGRVVPIWPGERPRWLAEEFNWVVGCSYVGQPNTLSRVRNPIGCNMSFRRSALDRIGMFREDIGRVDKNGLACDETELSIRACQAFPSATILYDPQAVVQHEVTKERARWNYFRNRCLAEGVSKTMVVGNVGSQQGLASERHYLVQVLPGAILRGFKETLLRFDPWGIVRSAGILAGVGYTAYGYFSTRLRFSWRATHG